MEEPRLQMLGVQPLAVQRGVKRIALQERVVLRMVLEMQVEKRKKLKMMSLREEWIRCWKVVGLQTRHN